MDTDNTRTLTVKDLRAHLGRLYTDEFYTDLDLEKDLTLSRITLEK